MQEIEVKARLKDREAVMQKLTDMGCTFAPEVTQEDTIYAELVGDLATFLSSQVFLRIRIVNGSKVIWTLKKPMNVNNTEHVVKIEHEVTVNSAEEAREMIKLLGYHEAVRNKKRRMTTNYKDYEVCIDELEGLGSFVEIEKLSKDGNAEEIQKDLFALLTTLGMNESDFVLKGYDILRLEQQAQTV